jgi:tRNA (guanine37-N1)-methyltransferase
MQFDIVTIFPGFFEGPFKSGILGRALATGKASVAIHNLRDFTFDPHQTVDDRPFGGGEGMVLRPSRFFWQWNRWALRQRIGEIPAANRLC